MSGKARERMKSDALRAKVRELLAAGMAPAAIAKATGKSYRHIALIVAQETTTDAP